LKRCTRRSKPFPLLPRIPDESLKPECLANTNTLSSEKVTETTPIPPPDWEALISVIASDILTEHTPQRILQVRAKLYDLLTHCIPPTTILRTLTFKLIPKVDDELKAEVIKWSAFYEHRIRLGTKVIFHLEAFVAKFMRILEAYLLSMDF
jgi:replication factor C subunit 3/5